MNKRVVFITLAAVILAGCSRDRDGLRRDQAQYETVQEGAASGVSPDLNPTTTQPLTALTGTNADTTTAFTLPNTIPPTPGAPSAPGTIAGTLPKPDSSYGYRPAAAAPAPRPRVVERAPEPSQPSAEPAEPAPAPERPAEQPVENEEAEEAEVPPPAPTSTQPPTPPTNTN